MLIVCDTSPIINLAMIDHLWLLPTLYKHIILPQTVYDEIVKDGYGQAGASEIRLADWVEVRNSKNFTLWYQLKTELDAGEAEAIALAVELNADRILIDEKLGRQKAIDLKLRPVGLLGILLRAKQDKHISSVKPIMDRLIDEANFFIHPKLYRDVLTAAKE